MFTYYAVQDTTENASVLRRGNGISELSPRYSLHLRLYYTCYVTLYSRNLQRSAVLRSRVLRSPQMSDPRSSEHGAALAHLSLHRVARTWYVRLFTHFYLARLSGRRLSGLGCTTLPCYEHSTLCLRRSRLPPMVYWNASRPSVGLGRCC